MAAAARLAAPPPPPAGGRRRPAGRGARRARWAPARRRRRSRAGRARGRERALPDADEHAAGRVERPRGALRMERAAERRELLSHGLEERRARRRRRRARAPPPPPPPPRPRPAPRRTRGRRRAARRRVPPPTARRRPASGNDDRRARVRRGRGGRYSTSMLAPAATGSVSSPLSESDERSGVWYAAAADGSGAAHSTQPACTAVSGARRPPPTSHQPAPRELRCSRRARARGA